MRKLLRSLALVLTLVAVVVTILPLDTLAFLPIGLAVLVCLFLLYQATPTEKKYPRALLWITAICSTIVLGKITLVKDKVETDQEFEKKKLETKIEAQKELQELEALENDLE